MPGGMPIWAYLGISLLATNTVVGTLVTHIILPCGCCPVALRHPRFFW
jgi:hypothetical protein